MVSSLKVKEDFLFSLSLLLKFSRVLFHFHSHLRKMLWCFGGVFCVVVPGIKQVKLLLLLMGVELETEMMIINVISGDWLKLIW